MSLGITAYTNVYSRFEKLGFGPVDLVMAKCDLRDELQVSNRSVCFFALAQNWLQRAGFSKRQVAAHQWDYCSGPVMEESTPRPRAITDPRVLFYYNGSTSSSPPTSPEDIGKVASGFNLYGGSGRVFVSGPHIDIDWVSQDAPSVNSLEQTLLEFVVQYVSRD